VVCPTRGVAAPSAGIRSGNSAEFVPVRAEPYAVDPGTRARGAAALAMKTTTGAPLAEDAAHAVDSVGDKHTRFEVEP
jgi:hypothetical protein